MIETTKEVFDTVSAHLLKQGMKAARTDDGKGGCFLRAVRASGSYSCAVGCLITDENYDQTLEFISAIDIGTINIELEIALIDSGVKALENNKFETIALLHDLQKMHDFDEPETWETKLNEIKQKHFEKVSELSE